METKIDHIIFTIGLLDYDSERKRLETLGLTVEVYAHEMEPPRITRTLNSWTAVVNLTNNIVSVIWFWTCALMPSFIQLVSASAGDTITETRAQTG